MDPEVDELIVKEELGPVKEKIKRIKKNPSEKIQRKKYSIEAIRSALKSIQEGSTLRKAGREHGIPLTSIHRYIKNPDKIDCKFGAPTTLSDSQEQDIVNWINYQTEEGYLLKKSDLLDYVQDYVLNLDIPNPFKNGRPSRHWYSAFLRRHTDIALKLCPKNLKTWYYDTKKYLASKNLLNIPSSQVFICDEANIQLHSKTDEMLIENIDEKMDVNEKDLFTIWFMYSADGVIAPPMIMYPYKAKVPKKVEGSIPNGWAYGLTENNFMIKEKFYEYITKVFYPWTTINDVTFPVVIYLNGLWPCMSPALEMFCQEHDIEIISLLPDSPNAVRYLETAFICILKDIWNIAMREWKVQNKNVRLKREHFALFLKESLDCVEEQKSEIQIWYSVNGLVPFDPEAVDFKTLKVKRKSLNNKPIVRLINQVKESDDDQLLRNFEKSLPTDLLESFKKCKEDDEIWTGDIKMTGLFEYWLSIKTGKEIVFSDSSFS